ncbi:hypothetical protein FOZ63_010085, partial [Perkinsus olseni]
QLTREQMKYATTDAYMPLHLGAKMGLVDLGVSGRGVTQQYGLRGRSVGLEEGELPGAASASSDGAEAASGVAKMGPASAKLKNSRSRAACAGQASLSWPKVIVNILPPNGGKARIISNRGKG